MKRSPLRRKTKLHPGKTRLRRTQLRRAGRRYDREQEAQRLFRASVLCISPRTGKIRAWCANTSRSDHLLGEPATDAHHLCPRSRGVGHPMLHDPRNGIPLCRSCHDAVHQGRHPDLLMGRDFLDTLLPDQPDQP